MNNTDSQNYFFQEYKMAKDPVLYYLFVRLNEIKAGQNRVLQYGICFNATAFKPDDIDHYALDVLMDRLFSMYPECYTHASGYKSFVYPVDGAEGFHRDKYGGTMWTNPKRLKLLDFMIEQLSREMGVSNG